MTKVEKIKLMQDYSSALTNIKALRRAQRESGTTKEWLPWGVAEANELASLEQFIAAHKNAVEAIAERVEGEIEWTSFTGATVSCSVKAAVKNFYLGDSSEVPFDVFFENENMDFFEKAMKDAIGKVKI